MSKSDVLLVALNAVTLFLAMIGLASQHADPMSVALVWAVFSTVVNGAVLIRRGARREPLPAPGREALPEADLDARRILDIDARLDALERAEDRRLRMLEVERGAPASGPGARVHHAAPSRNGRPT